VNEEEPQDFVLVEEGNVGLVFRCHDKRDEVLGQIACAAAFDAERQVRRANDLKLGAESQAAHFLHEREVTEAGLSLLVAERNGLIAEVKRQEKVINGDALQALKTVIGEIQLTKTSPTRIAISVRDWAKLLSAINELRP
jgi:hypothetical protein